jgi:Tfp pilus assembly protein PilO
MSLTESSERRASAKSRLLDRLHDPTQLRIFLTATVLLIGYGAVYRPLDEHIAATKRNLTEAQKRLALAHDVEQLRAQFRPVEQRLPQQSDSKEWEQFMLSSIRKFPLKLESFKPDAPRDLGPYKAIAMQIELSGTFVELDKFLYWLESNKRFFRVDQVNIAPGAAKTGTDLMMKITVLGIMG